MRKYFIKLRNKIKIFIFGEDSPIILNQIWYTRYSGPWSTRIQITNIINNWIEYRYILWNGNELKSDRKYSMRDGELHRNYRLIK
jgi:hypothetical protein